MDWVAAAFELCGNWLVGNKKPAAFVFYMVCNVLWALTAIHKGIYGLLMITVVSFVINVRNLRKWKRVEPS